MEFQNLVLEIFESVITNFSGHLFNLFDNQLCLMFHGTEFKEQNHEHILYYFLFPSLIKSR